MPIAIQYVEGEVYPPLDLKHEIVKLLIETFIKPIPQ